MVNWKKLKWGDLVTLEYGKGIRGYEQETGSYRVFGTNGPIGWYSKFLCDHPTVVVGRKGAYRGIHFSSSPCFIIDTAFYISPKEEFDMRWAYYELLTQNINGMDSGSAIPSTSREDFYKLSVMVPSLHEQKGIAHTLGTLDDKIALNRQMNRTLEAIAQALFRQWFLEAFGAGWKMLPISEIAEINSSTLSKNDELDQIEYVEISEVSRGDIGKIQIFERGKEPSRARRRVRHGDTVISTVRPDRGSYFLCLNPSPNLIVSTGFAVITPIKAPWSFIHAALTQADVFNYLGHQADGGAYPAVSPEIIGKWEVPWPNDLKLVVDFHKISGPLYELAERNRLESHTLTALRDTLLPQLMSGKIRVKVSENEIAAK